MADINLLPWRSEKRRLHRKQWIGCLLLGGAGVVGMLWVMNDWVLLRVATQTARNERLNHEISRLKHEVSEIEVLKTTRQALVQKMRVLEALQANRGITVLLLDGLMTIMPDGVFLNRVIREGDTVIVSGYAKSNRLVSELMRRIKHHRLSDAPTLREIKKSKESGKRAVNAFQLGVLLRTERTS